MILPFRTQMNGKPTYFVEKILKGLLDNNLIDSVRNLMFHEPPIEVPIYQPKLHTLREDKNDRWHAGTNIDFFINCRQKDMFRFAPVLPVVSVQKIKIKHGIDYTSIWCGDILYEVEHDGFRKNYQHDDFVLKLAQNDGFDTIEDFFAYFNEDFKGKIIHWTDLRY